MFRFAPRTLIATLMAGAFAIAGLTATPAQAGSDDAAKVIAGLATLFIIAKALDDDDHGKAYRPHRHHTHKPHAKPHRRHLNLPRKCVKTVRTRDGKQRILGRHCLNNNYRHVSQLPNACAIKVKTRDGKRFGYSPHCLRNKGYRIVN